MHSDGCILYIIRELIELGLDALNSQLFCMGLENIAHYKGQITFWGEIDRQHILPEGTVEDVDEVVKNVHSHLWNNEGSGLTLKWNTTDTSQGHCQNQHHHPQDPFSGA